MSAGAAMAPTSAALAPMVSMAPMAAGWTPARNSFRVRTKNSALTLKLQSAAETVMARRNPRESKNRTPSAMSVRSVVGGWTRTGAGSAVARRVRARAEIAKVTASTRKGAHLKSE